MSMKDILVEITDAMRIQVANDKKSIPESALRDTPLFNRQAYSFTQSISAKSGVIAEFKRRSPSKGSINATTDVVGITKGYEIAGASAVSILTNAPYFGGCNQYVTEARKNLTIPILRKEFIVDPYQIIEAKAIGADLILLIAECLTSSQIAEFTDIAHSVGLQVLMELHHENQVDKIIPSLDAVGINNRDLSTFKVDIEQSISLARSLPSALIKIAESGLSDSATATRMKAQGFDGFLVGEQFMKQKDPALACKDFIKNI